MTPARTGSPGYIPVENLGSDIEAGPDGDVFSFGVLMLLTFLRPAARANNIFAHPVRMLIRGGILNTGRTYGAHKKLPGIY